jgi:hypothetical protein
MTDEEFDELRPSAFAIATRRRRRVRVTLTAGASSRSAVNPQSTWSR